MTKTETVVTGKTDKIGSVSFAVASKLPKLTLTAADMSKEASSGGDVDYYSTVTEANNVKKEEYVPVLTAKVSEDGESSTVYSCTATLTVSVDGDVTFTANDKAVVSLQTSSSVQNASLTTSQFNLEDAESPKTTTLKFDITGANTTDTNVVEAYLKITNSQESEQQGNLAGKTFNIQLATTAFSCDPKVAE